MYVKIFVIFFVALSLISCSNMNSQNSNNQEVSLNLIVGSDYKFEFDDISEVVQTIGKNGNKITTSTQYKIDFLYNIACKSKSGYVVLVKLIYCEIQNMSKGSSVEGPLEKDSTFFRKSDEALTGMVLTINLDFKGAIKTLSGFKEHSVKGLASGKPLLDENYFKRILEKISSSLPDSKIPVGYSWKPAGFNENGFEYTSNNFELDSISGDFCHISGSSQTMQRVVFNNTPLVMIGKEHAVIHLELQTGIALKYNRTMKAAGSCMIGEIEVSQFVSKIHKLLGRRIKT